MIARLVAAALLGCLALAPARSVADETDFTLVDRMPGVAGHLIGELSSHDPARGLFFRKSVYEERLDGLVIRAIRVELSCGATAPSPGADGPTIIAFKHLPILPTSFAAATLHDVFTETYVRDRQGGIRVYLGLHATDMEAMTDRIAPSCPRI